MFPTFSNPKPNIFQHPILFASTGHSCCGHIVPGLEAGRRGTVAAKLSVALVGGRASGARDRSAFSREDGSQWDLNGISMGSQWDLNGIL